MVREAELWLAYDRGLLELAADYVQLGRVRAARRRGCELAAEIEGSEATHATRVELARDGAGALQVEAHCACRSRRRLCRHALALLLLWARQPEAFAPVDRWEREAARLSGPVLAQALAASAMGRSDPLASLRALVTVDWDRAPAGVCLQAWEAFRAQHAARGEWPEAGFALAARIVAAAEGQDPSRWLAVRQLCWWLLRMLGELPAPVRAAWLALLRQWLQAGEDPPPELGVWLADLALALSADERAEARWLVRWAAAGACARALEAELQRLRWEAELQAHLVADPPPGGETAAPWARAAAAAELLGVWQAERL